MHFLRADAADKVMLEEAEAGGHFQTLEPGGAKM